ncbi:MAG: glycosyltransferase family 1 protein [Zavarzinella sp.]|nr:glycosyltransferase family 1 protein [Zavarzinella sp.]
MMRVAMISEHASPLACLGGADGGGQNVYVAQLARHLGRAGYDVDVFTRRDDPGQPPAVEFAPNARVVHVPAGPPERVRKEDQLPYMGAFARFLVRWARRTGGYNVLHANFFMSALAACEAKRELGAPVVVTFHALGRVRRLHQGPADNFPAERLAIEDRVVAEADRIIAECPQDATDLTTLYRADRARLQTVPCGFDPEEFGPMNRLRVRAALRLSPAQFVVLQLGRMVPRKGVDNVIRGVGLLRRAHGIDARLLVVGGESRDPDPAVTPELGRLMAVAAEEGMSDRVTFSGARGRSELRAYYAAADVFVTTPWYEPFGITPLEAMACGTPVIGANVGGIKYSVRDGQTGFLVPPKDPAALAERLAILARDPELLRGMSRRARLRAVANFTWARVAEQVARVYAEVARPTPLVRTLAGNVAREVRSSP